jgi:transcriptional regulator GlxA family with amidase domain
MIQRIRLAALALVVSTIVAPGRSFAAPAVSSPAATPERSTRYTRNVAIVLYEGVELLDFAGPGEVFKAAASFAAYKDQPAFNLYTVAATSKPITSQGFVKITPSYSIEDAPRPDIIVIPGGNSRTLTEDAKFMAWAGKATREADITLTVCTGAFVAGKAGLLDGAIATTWFGATDRLRQAFPKTTVQPGRRFVDNGSVITTAGVSAGIDGALHTVARLLGRAVADQTARYMEYHWTPEPYLSIDYSLLNPSLDDAGRAAQQAELVAVRKD